MSEIITFPGTVPECDTQPERSAELSIIEPAPAAEFFSADLARLHTFGSFARFTFSVPEICAEASNAPIQNIVNVKLVVPTEKLAAIYKKIGDCLAAMDATKQP